jgi:ATP-dependent DNA helicase RecQ
VKIESRILGWASDGLLDYRPSGRELLLEILPPPADAMARLKGLIDRYSAIQAQRIDEIAAYAATDSCRHGHICTYLSGKAFESCQACDNCQSPPSQMGADAEVVELPSEREQFLAILRCLADSPGGWGRANLAYILLGNQRASMRAREASQWGALAFRSRTAVGNLIDRLLVGGLLRTRKLDHGGETLLLTRAGQAALDEPARLSSLTVRAKPPTKHIQSTLGAKGSSHLDDEELFQRLRAWRRETALATGVPAFVVAHDAVLRRIAQARPQDITELDAIPGIGPKKLSQFGGEILELVRGVAVDGAAHASARSEDAT